MGVLNTTSTRGYLKGAISYRVHANCHLKQNILLYIIHRGPCSLLSCHGKHFATLHVLNLSNHTPKYRSRPNLVSFFGEKWIQLIIREVSVSFVNFPLPAIGLHLFWCHGHVPWCGRLHLHSSRPSRGYSAGANHWGCATHLTGRCLIPSGSSLTTWSGCGSWRFCTSTVCSGSLCPAWSGMPWGLTF